jgi:hypothetical protein
MNNKRVFGTSTEKLHILYPNLFTILKRGNRKSRILLHSTQPINVKSEIWGPQTPCLWRIVSSEMSRRVVWTSARLHGVTSQKEVLN